VLPDSAEPGVDSIERGMFVENSELAAGDAGGVAVAGSWMVVVTRSSARLATRKRRAEMAGYGQGA
jgi:hypothetical protein